MVDPAQDISRGLSRRPRAASAVPPEWTKAGKKLDAGVGCIRFKKLEDVSLEVIAASLKRVTAKSHLAWYETIREKYEAEKAAKKKKK